MTAFMMSIALVLQLLMLALLRQNNQITTQPARLVGAGTLFAISTTIFIAQYGSLAGSIVSISVISCVGMIYALLKR
jgi:hypothetical protein